MTVDDEIDLSSPQMDGGGVLKGFGDNWAGDISPSLSMDSTVIPSDLGALAPCFAFVVPCFSVHSGERTRSDCGRDAKRFV